MTYREGLCKLRATGAGMGQQPARDGVVHDECHAYK